MPVEDRTLVAVVPHFVPDNHHSHGILPLLPNYFYIESLGSMQGFEHRVTVTVKLVAS
jgi:hypothetical protein